MCVQGLPLNPGAIAYGSSTYSPQRKGPSCLEQISAGDSVKLNRDQAGSNVACFRPTYAWRLMGKYRWG